MDRDDLLGRTMSLAEEWDWAGAVELLQEHVEDFDEEPAVHCWLGVAEREVGTAGVPYLCVKRALALQPVDR